MAPLNSCKRSRNNFWNNEAINCPSVHFQSMEPGLQAPHVGKSATLPKIFQNGIRASAYSATAAYRFAHTLQFVPSTTIRNVSTRHRRPFNPPLSARRILRITPLRFKFTRKTAHLAACAPASVLQKAKQIPRTRRSIWWQRIKFLRTAEIIYNFSKHSPIKRTRTKCWI